MINGSCQWRGVEVGLKKETEGFALFAATCSCSLFSAEVRARCCIGVVVCCEGWRCVRELGARCVRLEMRGCRSAGSVVLVLGTALVVGRRC